MNHKDLGDYIAWKVILWITGLVFFLVMSAILGWFAQGWFRYP
jgi:Mg2+ and Co2+ transporter CorA